MWKSNRIMQKYFFANFNVVHALFRAAAHHGAAGADASAAQLRILDKKL